MTGIVEKSVHFRYSPLAFAEIKAESSRTNPRLVMLYHFLSPFFEPSNVSLTVLNPNGSTRETWSWTPFNRTEFPYFFLTSDITVGLKRGSTSQTPPPFFDLAVLIMALHILMSRYIFTKIQISNTIIKTLKRGETGNPKQENF